MKSQIKNLKKKQKNQKYKFVELLIPTLSKFIRYQLLLILWTHSEMLYAMLKLLGLLFYKILSSMFISGKHKYDLGDN